MTARMAADTSIGIADLARPARTRGRWPADGLPGGSPGIESLGRLPSALSIESPLLVVESDFAAAVELAELDGVDGFRLNGIDAYDQSGQEVASAGDVNGDGFDDLIIAAILADPGGDDGAGESYVVFGKARGFAAQLDLAALDGANGFRLEGIDAGDGSGSSVASAGDFNGDGFADLIIGAFGGDPGGDDNAGESYVVFGKSSGFAPVLDLANLDGVNGFRLDGVDAYDRSGASVASAGDVNGDGLDDLIVGAPYAGADYAGESYVVFGRSSGFAPTLDLAALDGANGFRLEGVDNGDQSGCSVASAGDVNGDGFADLIIGARFAEAGGASTAGNAHVVFGKAGGFAAAIDLATLDGANGFRLDGIDFGDLSGSAVASAGDINGDGFADLIIGAPNAYSDGETIHGEAYVVFGKAGGFASSLDLGSLDGANGFRIDGIDQFDTLGYSVASAGDVNGDGFADIVVGAPAAYADGKRFAGESYVIFGRANGFAATFDLTTLDGENGFRLDGIDAGDRSGWPGASAGDVNDDGFGDLVIGAFGADPNGVGGAGESYVVFGRAPTTAVERIGADGDQTIRGGDFDDTLFGEGGSDVLIGADGADKLNGGKGVDVLEGAHGDDTLRGGGGRDALIGGEGADRIVAPGSFDRAAADVVYGFESGVDEIALQGAIFGLAPGVLDADSFVVFNQAQDAEDRLIYKADSGKLYFDHDGNGAQAQVLIATLVGAPTLSAGDFVVI